jgi:hypothetical protein
MNDCEHRNGLKWLLTLKRLNAKWQMAQKLKMIKLAIHDIM